MAREFVIDGHYYTSPNQQEEPPTLSFSHSASLPDNASPTQLRGRVWALHHSPYLPFALMSPFHGEMTCFATPPELLPLENGKHGFHLPTDVAKSWKDVEQSCHQIATVLRSFYEVGHPKVFLNCSIPPSPSKFGYLNSYSTEKKARFALSESLDAFVILLAYVSFCIAICRASEDPTSVSLSTSKQPRWFCTLSLRSSSVKPKWLQVLADSPVADFSTTTHRLGTIINVARCSWLHLVPYMLRANVPIWLYWGTPPIFVQPLHDGALNFAPRSHPQCRAPSLPVVASSQPLPVVASSQSVGLPVRSAHTDPDQLPGETWKDFMIRQNNRRREKLSKENKDQRQARVDREKSAADRRCPGKKGPVVFLWENDGGVWTRTLIPRGLVERSWGRFRYSQRIYNSIDNCWDLCVEFDAGTAGDDYEYDSNDSDNDVYSPKQLRRSPTPKKGSTPILVDPMPNSVPIPAQVSSDYPPMDVDPIVPHSDPSPVPILSDCPPIIVDPSDPAPQSVLIPPQVASDCPRMAIDSHDPTPLSFSMPAQLASRDLQHCPPVVVDAIPHSDPSPAPILSDCPPMLVDSSDTAPQSVRTPPQVAADSLSMSDTQPEGDFGGADDSGDDEDMYDASEQDVPHAYLNVPLDLAEVPVTKLDDLLYYRYGFSLNESPYTGIPALPEGVTRPFCSWTEVCRSVGGQQLVSSESAVDRDVIKDFLSILAGSADPFKDVPGKFWDLSASGRNPIVDLTKVFISIEKKQFTDREHYIIRPRRGCLHPSRDTSWVLSVDPMTALECIRRGFGPNTIDIANFLVSRGVRFSTLERISNFENSENRPQCRYLGYRPVNYVFDLADFAGYEALRDSFLRSQPHGPLALREGGIVARLAREVLPNSNALSGPSSEALNGHHARFICDNETYVDDSFLDVELGLICGTYVLGDTNTRGVLPKKVSWFPPPNIWNMCGYNVGQWTEECETWFQDHVSKIHSRSFQPLSSKAWRTHIRNTRLTVKVMYQMQKAAADYISAKQHFLVDSS